MCSESSSALHVHDSSLLVADINSMPKACLVALIESASADPAVLRIEIGSTPRFQSVTAETGSSSSSTSWDTYKAAGLTGLNQTGAVMDTGLDDLSCFFVEDIVGDNPDDILTPRDGLVYKDRRKVIQYIPYADMTDYQGGHGTHVTGTVLGSSLTTNITFSNGLDRVNGVAVDSKVSFQDIGDEHGELGALLNVSLYRDAFPAAYSAGARVHTDGWTSETTYDLYAGDVDKYTYQNPDFLGELLCVSCMHLRLLIYSIILLH